jgi:hypothetical protein
MKTRPYDIEYFSVMAGSCWAMPWVVEFYSVDKVRFVRLLGFSGLETGLHSLRSSLFHKRCKTVCHDINHNSVRHVIS